MVQTAVLMQTQAEAVRTVSGTGRALRPLSLLVLVPKPTGMSPGQRFRLEQWAPLVSANHGITLTFLPFESAGLTRVLYQPGLHIEKAGRIAFDFARRAKALKAARNYDGVIVYREAALIGPGFYESLLSWLDIPMLFDFDDAIWRESELHASTNGPFSRLHFWGKTSTTCRLSRAVLAGNSYLADYARKRNPNVFILPTSIDLKNYPLQPELDSDEPFVICWTGSTSTLAHFDQARTVLEKLAARRKIVVKVICNRPPERPIPGAENLFVPWTESEEAQTIGASHVGIMPLPDDDYTKGKCGLKALQYMATGRPVVIAPVGMNVDLIDNGKNGFLARSNDEWLAALTSLADSRELRAKIGMAGRKTIEERYSAEVVSDMFARVVRSMLD